MKKNILLILLAAFLGIIFFGSCTVSPSASCITISNPTDIPLSNVKIGQLLIASYLAPGAKTDYWIYQTTAGQLTFTGNFGYPSYQNASTGDIKTLDKFNLEFDMNYNYNITTTIGKSLNDTSDNYYIFISSKEQGSLYTKIDFDITDGYQPQIF